MGAHGSRYSRRLGSIPALLLASSLLGTLPVGCGQRGPLYLPEDRPAGAAGAAAAEPGSRAEDAAEGDVRAGQSGPASDSPDDDDRQR